MRYEALEGSSILSFVRLASPVVLCRFQFCNTSSFRSKASPAFCQAFGRNTVGLLVDKPVIILDFRVGNCSNKKFHHLVCKTVRLLQCKGFCLVHKF